VPKWGQVSPSDSEPRSANSAAAKILHPLFGLPRVPHVSSIGPSFNWALTVGLHDTEEGPFLTPSLREVPATGSSPSPSEPKHSTGRKLKVFWTAYSHTTREAAEKKKGAAQARAVTEACWVLFNAVDTWCEGGLQALKTQGQTRTLKSGTHRL